MRTALIATLFAAPAARAPALLLATLLAAISLPAKANEQPQSPSPSQTSTAQDTSAAHESPLIAYAQQLGESDSRSTRKAAHIATTNLRAVSFELSRHPPPRDEDCAHTLGAQRFAEQYARLAAIQDELGNFEAVIAANKSALACEPRVASYQASIASAHLSLGQIAEARAAVERGNAMDPDAVDVRNARARIDFIEERWADATARFRLEALERARYGEYADYSRCYLWLAQRRAGVRNPELPPKAPEKKSPNDTNAEQDPEHWPIPILQTLQGERSEAALVKRIEDGGATEAREWLTEALFYIGELRLAEGDVESARRHFATVVNLHVLNFVEYGMARAELARMRDRKPVATAETPGAGTQPR